MGISAHLCQRLIGAYGPASFLVVFRRLPFTISNVFFSETTGPIKVKCYVEPPWEGGTKVYINGSGHMTKMADMTIYGKTLKKLLLQNRKSNDLETWHAKSETQALQSFYKK